MSLKCARSRLTMTSTVFAFATSILILLHTQVSGQLSDLRKSSTRTVKLSPSCQSFPLPTVNPSALQSSLQDDIAEAEKAIEVSLKKYGPSVGGVVVNLVYRDTVLWSKGFGAIDMSGKSNWICHMHWCFNCTLCTHVVLHDSCSINHA